LADAYFGKGGVEVNLISGYVWSLISLDTATKVVKSEKKAKFLEFHQSVIDKYFPSIKKGIEKELTPAQIVEAQKLARECIRKKYKGC